MSANLTDRALKILLRNKELFVACYTPVEVQSKIDFSTGVQLRRHNISFLKGAIVSKSEMSSFLKDEIVANVNNIYLLVRNSGDITLDSVLFIHGLDYSVNRMFTSFYAGWALVMLSRVQGTSILSVEASRLHCSDRVKAYTDKLITDIKTYYNDILPDDLELWPIVGFTLQDSLSYIYPYGKKAEAVGDVAYKELGRKSGYSGLGTIDRQTPKLATGYVRTNKPELSSILNSFDQLMGRI